MGAQRYRAVIISPCLSLDARVAALLAQFAQNGGTTEGAIGIAEKANKVRRKPLRVILNGLGKDAAQIISRINGFTFVETQYDYLSLIHILPIIPKIIRKAADSHS